MTLQTTIPLAEYVENGVTLNHAIPFQFEAASDIVCSRISAGVETPLTLGADYSVAGGGGATGTVTKASGGPVGTIFRIKRVTTRAQPTDYTPGDAFPAETHEAALDRLAAVNQEQDVRLADVESRAVRVPVGEIAPLLPAKVSRAGKYLAADAVGNIVPASGTGNDAALRGDLAQGTGAALLGWIANATGAVVRSILDKLRETVSVTDFGADPTATADSLAAFTLAFASGKNLRIPEGTYILSACPPAPTGSMIVRGAGKGKTVLLINHGAARALYFTPASVNNRLELTGFTMLANSAGGPCPLGIEIAFPSSSSYPYRQVKLDVELLTDLAATSPTWARTWGRGVRLTNVWYPAISIVGSSAPIPGDTGNTGFLEVTGGDYGCVGANIEATWYYGADFIRGSAYMEGISIKAGSEAVGVTRGVYVPSTTANGGAAGLFRAASIFFGGHIAAHTAAFDLDNVFDVEASGNIQRWADASATNWIGYKFNNVLYPKIAGTIGGNDASGGITTTGISATGGNSAHGIVSRVHFQDLDTQFNLAGPTSHWTLRGNVATGATPDTFVLAGANHDVEWLNAAGYIQRFVNGVVTAGPHYSAVGEIGKISAAGVTYSAAELLSDAIFRSGAAAVSDTTPTAAQIVAAIPGALVGTGKRITINNMNSGLLTLIAGTGVTLVGTTTIANSASRDYLVRITNPGPGVEAVRLVGLQTGSV